MLQLHLVIHKFIAHQGASNIKMFDGMLNMDGLAILGSEFQQPALFHYQGMMKILMQASLKT